MFGVAVKNKLCNKVNLIKIKEIEFDSKTTKEIASESIGCLPTHLSLYQSSLSCSHTFLMRADHSSSSCLSCHPASCGYLPGWRSFEVGIRQHQSSFVQSEAADSGTSQQWWSGTISSNGSPVSTADRLVLAPPDGRGEGPCPLRAVT